MSSHDGEPSSGDFSAKSTKVLQLASKNCEAKQAKQGKQANLEFEPTRDQRRNGAKIISTFVNCLSEVFEQELTEETERRIALLSPFPPVPSILKIYQAEFLKGILYRRSTKCVRMNWFAFPIRFRKVSFVFRTPFSTFPK